MRGIDFRLWRPCATCPFTPAGFGLGGQRMAGICNSLERKTFPCHHTTSAGRPQPRDARGRFKPWEWSHCAGALIVMARDGIWGDLQQVAMRLGLFDPSKLDLTAPTYPSLEACVEAHGGKLKWIGHRTLVGPRKSTVNCSGRPIVGHDEDTQAQA